jgi:hypothetical protein
VPNTLGLSNRKIRQEKGKDSLKRDCLFTLFPLPLPGILPRSMLSTAAVLSSSFVGSAHRAGPSITMQATTTLNGLPGTPGGPEFAKTLPGVLAPFGYLCAVLLTAELPLTRMNLGRLRIPGLVHPNLDLCASYPWASPASYAAPDHILTVIHST